jgi:O-antigen ligase
VNASRSGRFVTVLFPLAVIAFIGPAVAYLNAVFTADSRWIVLLALGASFVFVRMPRLPPEVVASGAAYLLWCLATVAWSTVAELSLYKATASLLVIVILIAAGERWIAIRGPQRAFDYLVLVLLAAIFASGFGMGSTLPISSEDGLPMYEGLVYGPNMLGSLVNLAMPFALWRVYRPWPSRRWRVLWILVILTLTWCLFSSFSRSAILAAAITVVGFAVAAGARGLPVLVMSAAVSLATMYLVFEKAGLVGDSVVAVFMYKSTDAEKDLLFTREHTWEESLELAKEGGWVGAGFGVSIGDDRWSGGMSAVGYGREKGNSQLAVVEETGVVGLALACLFLALIFRRLIGACIQESNREVRVALGLVIGAAGGLLVQSVFEAWWVSPGSPESVAFWALIGVGLGLSRLR